MLGEESSGTVIADVEIQLCPGCVEVVSDKLMEFRRSLLGEVDGGRFGE
jgi:hypothetical protein